MLYLITPDNKYFFKDELEKLYQARYRTFYLKNKWDLKVGNHIEKDQFDTDDAYNLIYVNSKNQVTGGVRLIPTIKKHMFREVFQDFIPSDAYQDGLPYE